MQERRNAERIRTNLNARWESLGAQGRGSVSDFSATGCFVLTGGEVKPQELIRLELIAGDQITVLWGFVVYQVPEMGFALRFVITGEDYREKIEGVIAQLDQSGNP